MPFKLHRDELPTINLTSMIDILFLLIIFFMVASHFGEPEQRVAIELPRAGNGNPANAAASQVVTVLRDGSTVFEGQTVNLNQLTNRVAMIKRQTPNLNVEVRVDGGATAEQFLPIFVALDRVGARVQMNYSSGMRR